MSESHEAPFSFTTKINGDLFTVRGGDPAEFARNLEWATEKIDEIVERVTTLQAAGNAASLVNTAAARPAAPAPASPPTGGWGNPAPAPAAQPGAPLCDHGQPMKLVPGGISKKTGQPYNAFYACSLPREQQCKKTVRL